jgi:thiol-disulfide isomerase/thioredoxin
MLKKSILPVALVFIMLTQGCSDKSEKDQNQAVAANTMVAESNFHLSDTNNKVITIAKEAQSFFIKDQKDKLVIFDIFATWCPPCKAVAPHLASLQKKYAADIVVIGVTIEDTITNEELEKFKAEYGADYTIVNSSENRKLTSAIASAIGAGERFPIPMMAMYKNGKYITHYVGAVPEEMIESDIQLALGK